MPFRQHLPPASAFAYTTKKKSEPRPACHDLDRASRLDYQLVDGPLQFCTPALFLGGPSVPAGISARRHLDHLAATTFRRPGHSGPGGELSLSTVVPLGRARPSSVRLVQIGAGSGGCEAPRDIPDVPARANYTQRLLHQALFVVAHKQQSTDKRRGRLLFTLLALVLADLLWRPWHRAGDGWEGPGHRAPRLWSSRIWAW